jgi:Trypsin-like peptidase domain/Eco57I restriction-modification methylase
VTLAVGRLVDSDTGAELGTVFAVTGQLALTTFHCVGDRDSGRVRSPQVRCEWPGGTSSAFVDESDCRNDIALLRLDRQLPPGLDPVPLARGVTEHARFAARGYPAAVPGVSPFTVSGEIVSISGSLAGKRALQLRCHEPAAGLSMHGMSGAPVLVGQPQRAVGILRWNPPSTERPELAMGGTALATPSSAVLDRWPQLGPARPADAADLGRIVRRLAQRRRGRSAAEIRARIWQLLIAGGLGLDDYDLDPDLEAPGDEYCHIAVRPGRTLIEISADLRSDEAVRGGERRLDRYLAMRIEETAMRQLGILTDGAEWRLYHRVRGTLRQAQSPRTVDAANPAAEELVSWLEAIFATAEHIKPTPAEIARKLGAGSPSYAADSAELAAIYSTCRDMPSVRVRREMWAKLLTTASGTNFANDDALFVDHTLLVVMAELIGHAVLDFDLEDSELTAEKIVSGTKFADSGIGGVVEPDFFDWIADAPDGTRFVRDLARRLARFAWDEVEHDVMKVLYQSIIPQHVRHRLGEYYTPDWLAEAIVIQSVTAPLSQRVLDASCGSGTFLFHAIRRYLAAAEAIGLTGPALFGELTRHVSGFDVHPVAVTLARVTYLLAIGMARLRDRPQFAVPVYLCDSLRWGQQDNIWSYKGLSVRTTLEHTDLLYDPEFIEDTDFHERLKFPDSVIGHASDFDRLVRELADIATNLGRRSRASLVAAFQRLGVPEDSRAVLEQTFKNMCDLHDRELDHIWGYYVRNLVRPVWLARPDNRVDVLVGNPPWLAYRYMTEVQKQSFDEMSTERKLKVGASLATSQDLAALFVARCIELYLKAGGRFGYVMPRGTLALGHYQRFRRGRYSVPAEQVTVAFDLPWDLHQIKPAFFTQSVGVIFGRRTSSTEAARELGRRTEEWSGRFNTRTAALAEALEHITRRIREPAPERQGSPYSNRFFQGAAVVPQVLFLVEDDDVGSLGVGANRRAVQSSRSANEHRPWKDVRSLRGVVEEQFIKHLYLGACILPFRILPPREAVIPWGDHLLSEDDLELHPGLAAWWRDAQRTWYRKRSDRRLSLLQQLDYRRKLSQQFPMPAYRVVYPKSAMYCTAAVISNADDEHAFIDQQLYWGQAATLGEARYLTAVLNAPGLISAVQKLQPRGEHNPRDIAKYVFHLPIPLYDPNDAAHQELAALAAHAERVAAAVHLPYVRFEAQRRRVRQALADDGVTADIDAIVSALLA